MRFRLISCEIFAREMCDAVVRSPHRVDIEFLPNGLHDIGAEGMLARLQEAVDRCEGAAYDAILLGYGLCNNGIVGLFSRSHQVVVPRAHDCITLFFGSRERYLEYFHSRPGTYFMTSGWLERGRDAGELTQLSIQHRMGMDLSYEELVARYGEDNAAYLRETLCDTLRNYGRLTYIHMGIEPDDRFERESRALAAERGWTFEAVDGDMGLIRRMLAGRWDEADFLVVPPGWQVRAAHDGAILRAEPATP